jgi:hypothetical protein
VASEALSSFYPDYEVEQKIRWVSFGV